MTLLPTFLPEWEYQYCDQCNFELITQDDIFIMKLPFDTDFGDKGDEVTLCVDCYMEIRGLDKTNKEEIRDS
jgi:hypothetical protein